MTRTSTVAFDRPQSAGEDATKPRNERFDESGFLGGAIYLAGMFVMAYNVWRTTTSTTIADEGEVAATPLLRTTPEAAS